MARDKAVAYLRVSGAGQVQGDGFARQRAAIERFAGVARLELVEEFRDEGISGTRELQNRPGLARVLDRVESNGVKVVIVERADRLARDLLVSEVILAQFRNAGVRVLTSDGAELTADDDPTRRLIRQVLGAVSEFDKSVTVLKLRAARDRIRSRTGRCEGRKPFGDRPGEADAIAMMRQLRRKTPKAMRRSYQAIADELNAQSIPSRTGRPWAAATVRGILARE
jgi:DNA invertase Pin-like site-specific DNA recombinase